MPKLRERRFPNFEVVRSDEVSLDFFALVRDIEAFCQSRGLTPLADLVRPRPMRVDHPCTQSLCSYKTVKRLAVELQFVARRLRMMEATPTQSTLVPASQEKPPRLS